MELLGSGLLEDEKYDRVNTNFTNVAQEAENSVITLCLLEK